MRRRCWQSKVVTENDYLRARASAQDARVKFETARQKLFTLGLSEEQIAALPQQPVASLRRQELRSPIAGRIAERRVELGALVGREGQESELFVIVDLAVVWLDLAVPPADLPAIREGQEITVAIGAGGKRVPARIMFVSPLLDRETRAARVVASSQILIRPGGRAASSRLRSRSTEDACRSPGPENRAADDQGRPRCVRAQRPKASRPARSPSGAKMTAMSKSLPGCLPAKPSPSSNTFILKAELGKAEAEHDD